MKVKHKYCYIDHLDNGHLMLRSGDWMKTPWYMPLRWIGYRWRRDEWFHGNSKGYRPGLAILWYYTNKQRIELLLDGQR